MGNTGFQSEYSPTLTEPNNSFTTPGAYAVGTNPYLYAMPYWASFGDHTAGTGNMLIADGDPTANQYVWQETVSGLSLGSLYTFSGYVASNNPSLNSPAVIELAVGGTQIGNTTTATGPAGTFDLFSATYTATAPSEAFQIYDTNLQIPYNDFALDDISLTTPAASPAVPEPAPLALFGLCLPGLVLLARKRVAR